MTSSERNIFIDKDEKKNPQTFSSALVATEELGINDGPFEWIRETNSDRKYLDYESKLKSFLTPEERIPEDILIEIFSVPFVDKGEKWGPLFSFSGERACVGVYLRDLSTFRSSTHLSSKVNHHNDAEKLYSDEDCLTLPKNVNESDIDGWKYVSLHFSKTGKFSDEQIREVPCFAMFPKGGLLMTVSVKDFSTYTTITSSSSKEAVDIHKEKSGQKYTTNGIYRVSTGLHQLGLTDDSEFTRNPPQTIRGALEMMKIPKSIQETYEAFRYLPEESSKWIKVWKEVQHGRICILMELTKAIRMEDGQPMNSFIGIRWFMRKMIIFFHPDTFRIRCDKCTNEITENVQMDEAISNWMKP